jgi:hypothetical protein
MSYLLICMARNIFPDLASQRSRACRMVVEMSSFCPRSVEQARDFNHLWNKISQDSDKIFGNKRRQTFIHRS